MSQGVIDLETYRDVQRAEREERQSLERKIEQLREELRLANVEIGGLREQLRRADARNAAMRGTTERGRYR